MNYILEGSETALRLHAAQAIEREPYPLAAPCSADRRRSWAGVREILVRCLDWLSEEPVLKALESDPAAARLVLDRWRPRTEWPETVEATGLAARTCSHLTHNWAVQRPLFHRWARVLGRLFQQADFCVVIPCANLSDWETLAVLKGVFRLDRTNWPRFIVGYDPTLVAAPRDENGIEWRVRPQYVHDAILDLLALPGSRHLRLPEDTTPAEPPDWLAAAPHRELGSLVEGLEADAIVALVGSEPPGRSESERVVRALEACFARYSFTTALSLGIDLLQRSTELDAATAARAHGIVALSAHNRQFSSQGNTVLGEFIASHLEAALKGETRPVERCALLYRLAVTYGRRLGKLEEADRWARAATLEAERAEAGPPRYQGAWARNIHAYVLSRRKQPEEARQCMREAFDHVSVASWGAQHAAQEGPALLGDLALTRSLAAHNLAVAEGLAGDLERYGEAVQTAGRLESLIERSAKYWGQSLVRHFRDVYRPDRAYAVAREGLAAAVKDRNASLRLFFLLHLADLALRLGRSGASIRYFFAARSLAAKLSPLADHPDLDLPTVLALEQAARYEQAEAILHGKVESANGMPAELRAEITSRLAILAGRSGKVDAAERWASRATEAAAESTLRHCLVRTAINLGRAAALLGQDGEARALALWAVELIGEREGPESISPVDELLALIEMHRCQGLSGDQSERLLGLFPAALSSTSTWLALGGVLEILNQEAAGRALSLASLQPALEAVVAAAQLRRDCRSKAAALRSRGFVAASDRPRPALPIGQGPNHESFRE